MYSTVVVDECFTVDESPARSAEVISWGPHNVLCVCTKWMVKLYLATLRQDAAHIIVRHHPLCYRHDRQSLETIQSARWASALLQETHYPATARLCVATSANLVVYRVSRHGDNGVRASRGTGIAVTNPGAIRQITLHPNEKIDIDDKNNDDNNNNNKEEENKCSERPSRGKSVTFSSNSEEYSKKQVKQSKNNINKGVKRSSDCATQKRYSWREQARQRQQKQRKQISRRKRAIRKTTYSDSNSNSSYSESEEESLSESDNSTSSYSSESSSSSSRSEEKKISVKRQRRASANNTLSSYNESSVMEKNNSSNLNDCYDARNQGRYSLIDYYWLEYEQLIVITNVGVHAISLWNNFSDEEQAQIISLPEEPHYTLIDDIIGINALYVACTCLVKLNTMYYDNKGSAYLLILASPFVLRVLLVLSKHPECNAMEGQLNSTCSTSSSGDSINNVCYSSKRSLAVEVLPLHYVEIPLMNSVPASICCYIDNNYFSKNSSSNNGSNANDGHYYECNERCNIGVFISLPNETIRGSFYAYINADCFTEHFNVEESSNINDRNKSNTTITNNNSNDSRELTASEWRLNTSFNLALLANETALRSLHVIDLANVQVPLAEELTESHIDNNRHSSRMTQWHSAQFILGVTRHCVFGFTSTGQQPMLLFECPSLASSFEMPLHSALAVSGVAVHASCTLCLLLLQNGEAYSIPLIIKPICVNDASGLLNRMLRLCGIEICKETNDAARNKYITEEQTNKVVCNDKRFLNTSRLDVKVQSNSLQMLLRERQRSYSFFVWELLFPSDAEFVSMRLYSEEWKRLMYYRGDNTKRLRYGNNNNVVTRQTNRRSVNKQMVELHSAEWALRTRYLKLRDDYGVDLFLRHLMPNNEEALTASLMQIGHDSNDNNTNIVTHKTEQH